MNRILDGLRIVENSAFVAAPLAGMTLAQMGAEVIRIDPPGGGLDARRWPVTGDGRSLYWSGLNKGKRSVCIDVRRHEGQELATALVTAAGEHAGLFITNFPARGWLDYEVLRGRRGDLVMVHVGGDSTGKSAVDYTVQAATGFPFVTGSGGHAEPVNSVLPAWDLITGVTAALGLVAAERHRRQSGQGQLVRLNLSDVAFATLGHLGYIADVQINGAERGRFGNDVFGAFGRDFTTADGRRVMVVAITKRQWDALRHATGLGERFTLIERLLDVDLDREADRYEARVFIAALLERWFRERRYGEVAEALDASGVCWGPYRTMAELVREDPRCSPANPLFQEVEQPGVGRYRMPGSPLDFGAAPRGAVTPAPALGEHTDQVLTDVLGLSQRELHRLHQHGIVACGAA